MPAPSLHIVQTTQSLPVQRDRLIRLHEVLSIVRVGKTTWLQLVKDGKAPRSVLITPRCVAWSEAACYAWVQARLAEASQQQQIEGMQ